MALFRLFFNIFPVLTSLSFAKNFFLCGVADDEYKKNKLIINNNNNNRANQTNENGKMINDIDKSSMTYFQQMSDKNDDNLVKLCGQLKKLLDLPAVLFSIILIQLFSFVLVLNIEECSPLVLFSWWRNKIS